MKEETYQDDLRYERAVWPENFHSVGTKTVFDEYQAEKKDGAEWRERLLLALQGIDLSLETIANSKQTLAERLSSDEESA